MSRKGCCIVDGAEVGMINLIDFINLAAYEMLRTIKRKHLDPIDILKY